MQLVDPTRTFDYVLKRERDLDSQDQSIFELMYLTAKQQAKIEDRMTSVHTKTQVASINSASVSLALLLEGLKGWRNVKGPDGHEARFDENNRNRMIDMIPPEDRAELADALSRSAKVTDDEEKNSN